MKRIEDAASQLQRNVEQHCSIKENKGIAIKGAFRMFAHFLGLNERNKCSAQAKDFVVHLFARFFHVRTHTTARIFLLNVNGACSS